MSLPAPWATITAAVRPAVNPCGTSSTPETVSSADTGMVTSSDLMAKTATDYKILYQTAVAGVGKLFMNATVPGPGPIADLILEAVLSENPRVVYSGGFLSQEILGKRFQLDDEGFHRFMGELTGLGVLRL